MKKGLIEINWNKVDDYSDSDITYFLFIEGKNIESICRIRNLDRTTVQNQIIEGKIKYRFLVNSSDSKELFRSLSRAGKRDKIEVLNSLKDENKRELINFIKANYKDMYPKDKEVAVWILGELRDINTLDILMKASVHKSINTRRMAISAMGKMENKKCEIPLIRALDDENPQVVMYAIKALLKIKSVKAKEKIKNIRDNAEKEYLKIAAEDYLDIVDSKGESL